MMERLLISMLVAVQIPFMFYLGGFDFTERSLLLAYCYFVTLFAYGVTYAGIPVWFPTLKSGKRNDHAE